MSLIAVFFLSLACAWASFPAARALSRSLGAMDLPDGKRKKHALVMPRGGGMEIFFAFGVGGFLTVLGRGTEALPFYALFSSGALLFALGLSDDVASLSATQKLLAELPILAIPVAFGLELPRISLFGQAVSLPPLLSRLLPWLLLLILTNAYNLIDGLDGLAAGNAVLLGAALSLLSGIRGNAVLLGLSLSYTAASLGFYLWNRPPAKIFMGDGGALFLGFVGTALFLSLFADTPMGVPLPSFLLLFAYPLADLSFAVIRRILHGQSPFRADGAHLHHRLCACGLSRSAAARFLLLCAAFCNALGIFYAFFRYFFYFFPFSY